MGGKVNHLLVSETFRSVQGEGPYIGWPASFIRMQYCNLRCTWCDAWYTWDPRRVDLKATTIRWSASRAALWLMQNDDPLVVLTGGEPLLQQEALLAMRDILTEHEWLNPLQVETNGTILPHQGWDKCSNKYFVVSPKLTNNGRDSVNRRLNPKAIEWYAEDRATFKFVLDTPEDLDEVQSFVERFKIRPSRVYIMPLGNTQEALRARLEWMLEACKATGWRYSDRLHIRAYGDRRGT